MSSQATRKYWYARCREASYIGILGSVAWTVALVLPFRPFDELPPVMAGGGPGEWLVIGYLLYVILGVGAFGWLSGLLHVIEMEEGRTISQSLMWPGFLMLLLGTTVSCVSLGCAGASGGYASLNGGTSSLHQMLAPYLYPLSATTIVAAAGAFMVLLAMVRARGT